MEPKLTPEEVSAITGEDIEDIRSAEHPEEATKLEIEESEDISKKGGSAALDLAEWDDEIEDEDREDFREAKIEFRKLLSTDREIYVRMASLRKDIRERTASKKVSARIDNLIAECNRTREGLEDVSRRQFLDIILKKLVELKNEIQAPAT